MPVQTGRPSLLLLSSPIPDYKRRGQALIGNPGSLLFPSSVKTRDGTQAVPYRIPRECRILGVFSLVVGLRWDFLPLPVVGEGWGEGEVVNE